MNGRVENDLKIFRQIENNLLDYPAYINSWYYYLKANNQSATTCKDYINKIIRFLEFIDLDIEDIELSDLNEDNIIKYFLKIKFKDDGSETSISYRQCIWSCLNNFFDFLYNKKMIPTNYFISSGINRPKGNDLEKINRNRKLLTKQDFKNIIDAVDSGAGTPKARKTQRKFRNRDKAILLILMTTGMRKTALQEINVEDIDFENNTLRIIDKGHKLHTYFLTDEIINVINKWLTDRYFILGRRVGGALFVSGKRKRMCGDSIANLVDKYAYEALGYHISPHKLRSGLASILYEEKHDIEYVRRVIGHSNITTTQRYIVTNNAEREEAANMISGLFS